MTISKRRRSRRFLAQAEQVAYYLSLTRVTTHSGLTRTVHLNLLPVTGAAMLLTRTGVLETVLSLGLLFFAVVAYCRSRMGAWWRVRKSTRRSPRVRERRSVSWIRVRWLLLLVAATSVWWGLFNKRAGGSRSLQLQVV